MRLSKKFSRLFFLFKKCFFWVPIKSLYEDFTAGINYAIVVNKFYVLHIFHASMQYLQSIKECFAQILFAPINSLAFAKVA